MHSSCSCLRFLDMSKPAVSPSPYVSLPRLRPAPSHRRTRRLASLPVEERSSARHPSLKETLEATTSRRGGEEGSSFWNLQRYLDNLYPLPAVYDLKVVEKRNPTALTTETEKEDDPTPDDYYVNFGKAIETIKDDFPQLFYRDFDYSIFREDLVFRDPINSFQGLRVYKYMLLSLRWHGRIFFKRVYVRIHSLWPRQEGTIRVRWSIHAVPRIPWEAESIFDGVSEYKLDSHGMIYEHSVDNIIFRDPPVFRLPVLFAQLSPISRNPVPSAWCRLKNSAGCYFVHRFSWILEMAKCGVCVRRFRADLDLFLYGVF